MHNFTKHTDNAATEAAMLQKLGKYIPVPEVYESGKDYIVMQKVPFSGPLSEEEFAKALAKMHAYKQPFFGYENDTTIGPFTQPNPQENSWPLFFGKHRVEYMARRCLEQNALQSKEFARIASFADDFNSYLPQTTPSILHGDLWGGNVMNDGTQTVLIDPASYFGSCEYDIAFSKLFHTFSSRFYDVYTYYQPLERDFFTNRVAIYNLYGLLVHLRAFGQMYKQPILSTLQKFGY